MCTDRHQSPFRAIRQHSYRMDCRCMLSSIITSRSRVDCVVSSSAVWASAWARLFCRHKHEQASVKHYSCGRAVVSHGQLCSAFADTH